MGNFNIFPYYVMEYCSSNNLTQLTKADDRFTIEKVVMLKK